MRTATGALLAAALVFAAPQARAGGGDDRGEKIITVRFRPPAESPILGPRFAPVTIELFCDLSDPRVGEIHRELIRLRARHPQRLRVIYRLVARGRSRARTHDYVEAGREAFAQRRFEPYLDALFDTRRRRSHRAALREAAERAGLDLEQFDRAIADDRHADAIRRDHYRRRRYRVRGVPGLLVNGTPYAQREVRGIEALEEAYDRAYARARALLDEGVSREELYPRLLRETLASRPRPELSAGSIDGLARGEAPPEGPPPLLGGAVDTSGPHTRGPDDARVVLVLFCSFSSRNCMSMSRVVADLLEAYPDELRLVFKHLFDEGDRAQQGARRLHEAALCADDQGAFWAFYDQIYSRHQRRNASDEALIEELEAIDSLDPERLARCLDQGRHAETVQDHLVSSHRLGVTLTPSLVIGGRLYVGTKTFDELRALIDRELAPGLLEQWVPTSSAEDI